MASSELDLHSSITYFIAGIIVTILIAAKVFQRSDLDTIPTVGSSSWLGSWRAGFMFTRNGLDVIREGYEKYKHRPFKVADQYRWLVIVSSREHMEELRRASEDQFSFSEAVRDRISADYTLGKEIHTNPYQIPILRSQLTRSIGAMCSDIRDEVVTTFDEVLDLKRDGEELMLHQYLLFTKIGEWKSVSALNTIQKVVFRTSNRLFVGLPLCRNPGWMDFNLQNALDVVNGGLFLQRFPAFLAPFIALFITNVTHSTERAMKYLAPIIEERQRYLDEYGNEWVDKPNDLLSWLMDVAEGEERTTKFLTARVFALNFASVHSTSQSFTHALFHLAANPQYIQPLREEVEAIIDQEGWSKAAFGKMRKIDSFLKENQRLKGTASESLARKAMKDFTFSDGTFIPKGTLISAPSWCLHLDDHLYDNAAVFDPFRFSRMREAVGQGTKHQFVSTSLEYLSFGHGRNACPGRFFVASEMKAMLAHIILSYDVKLEDATAPESTYVASSITVDPNARIMFRKRN